MSCFWQSVDFITPACVYRVLNQDGCASRLYFAAGFLTPCMRDVERETEWRPYVEVGS